MRSFFIFNLKYFFIIKIFLLFLYYKTKQMETQFQNIGYFIEYIINTKLIGTKLINKPDRKEIGYYSTQHHIAVDDIVFSNKKRIKKGQSYYTRLYPLCGHKK